MSKLTIGDEPERKGDVCYPSPIQIHKYTSAEAAKRLHKGEK